jgi:hypothetical protein
MVLVTGCPSDDDTAGDAAGRGSNTGGTGAPATSTNKMMVKVSCTETKPDRCITTDVRAAPSFVHDCYGKPEVPSCPNMAHVGACEIWATGYGPMTNSRGDTIVKLDLSSDRTTTTYYPAEDADDDDIVGWRDGCLHDNDKTDRADKMFAMVKASWIWADGYSEADYAPYSKPTSAYFDENGPKGLVNTDPLDGKALSGSCYEYGSTKCTSSYGDYDWAKQYLRETCDSQIEQFVETSCPVNPYLIGSCKLPAQNKITVIHYYVDEGTTNVAAAKLAASGIRSACPGTFVDNDTFMFK